MGGHDLVIKNRRHGKNTASNTLMKLLTLLKYVSLNLKIIRVIKKRFKIKKQN